MEMCCAKCRNGDCVNARWIESMWTSRMAQQVERYLENPQFADVSTPRYAQIAAMDFRDLFAKGQQMVEANKRGDWIPEVAITDGRTEIAAKETTQAVERAVRSLVSPQDPPEEPVEPAEEPEGAQAPPEPPPKPEPPPRPAPAPPRVRPMNTPVPPGGYVLGPDPGPTPKRVREKAPDPWAVPEKRLPVGGTVRMGEVCDD